MAKYQLYESAAFSAASDKGEKCIYARPVNSVTYTTEDAIQAIQERCTLTSTDVVAVVEALREYIQKVLKNGDRMKLDGLGTFSVSLSCRKEESKKKIRAKDVHFAQVNFQAATSMNQELKKMQLEHSEKSPKQTTSIDERWNAVTQFLSHNTVITSTDYLKFSFVTRYRSYEDLKQWVEEGKLTCKGSSHSKYYVLTKKSDEQ